MRLETADIVLRFRASLLAEGDPESDPVLANFGGPFPPELWIAAMMAEDLAGLNWLWSRGGLPATTRTYPTQFAAAHDRLISLQWLVARGFSWKSTTCQAALAHAPSGATAAWLSRLSASELPCRAGSGQALCPVHRYDAWDYRDVREVWVALFSQVGAGRDPATAGAEDGPDLSALPQVAADMSIETLAMCAVRADNRPALAWIGEQIPGFLFGNEYIRHATAHGCPRALAWLATAQA